MPSTEVVLPSTTRVYNSLSLMLLPEGFPVALWTPSGVHPPVSIRSRCFQGAFRSPLGTLRHPTCRIPSSRRNPMFHFHLIPSSKECTRRGAGGDRKAPCEQETSKRCYPQLLFGGGYGRGSFWHKSFPSRNTRKLPPPCPSMRDMV